MTPFNQIWGGHRTQTISKFQNYFFSAEIIPARIALFTSTFHLPTCFMYPSTKKRSSTDTFLSSLKKSALSKNHLDQFF